MKVLYFLTLFFLLIVGVEAQSCSGSTQLSIVYSASNTWTYTATASTGGATNPAIFDLMHFNQTSWIPLYLAGKHNSDTTMFLQVFYRVLDSGGNCVVNRSTKLVGCAGNIFLNNTTYIGGFSLYYYDNIKEWYIYFTYVSPLDSLPLPANLTFRVANCWPLADYYCAINYYQNYQTQPFTYNYTISELQTFIYKCSISPVSGCNVNVGGVGYRSIQGFGMSHSSGTATATLTARLATVFKADVSMEYDANTQTIAINITNANFNGYVVYNNQNYNISRNQVTIIRSLALSDVLDFYNTLNQKIATINLQSYLSCFKTAQIQETKTLIVKDLAGNRLQSFKVVFAGGEEFVATDFAANVTIMPSGTYNVTIYPLLLPFAYNTTLTLAPGVNEVTVPVYAYFVNLRVFYRPPPVGSAGSTVLPLSFYYNYTGEVRPNKTTVVGTVASSVMYANENATVQLLAGNYNFTVKTRIMFAERTKTVNVSLLDDKYNKYITVYFGLAGEEAQIGESISPILRVVVLDQYNNPVNNVTIKVYDNNSLVANQVARDGAAIVGGVEIGKSYKIEVWLGVVKKAEKTVTVTSPLEQVFIVINLREEERRIIESGGDAVAPAAGTSGNQAFYISLANNLLTNPAIWGLVIVIALAIIASANAGERIGLITFIAGLGVFTYVIPLIPQVIFVVVAIVAFILFSWKVLNKFVEGGDE